MTKFLLAVRKAYDTKRIAFVIAFCAVAVFLYFAPYIVGASVGSQYISLFQAWFTIDSMQVLIAEGLITQFEVYFYRILALVFFIASVAGAVSIIKAKWCAAFSLPLAFFALYFVCETTATRNRMGVLMPSESAHSAFYIIICLLVILAVVLILLATYLPLKEPAPAEPKPERKRKPSKAERIAELEARVRELEDRDSLND